MKKYLFAILVNLSFYCVIGQTEIPEGKYPYHTYIEWPGKGGLFINSDPSEKARDFNMSFINSDGELQWQETIYPKTFSTIPVVSASSNYIYFFDQLEIEKNKLYYHQINSNGSVKSTNIDFLRELKLLGYSTPDDAVVQNIINTEKALVFQLLIENKTEKVFDHILVFLTHHNHRIYTAQLTPTNFANFKADYTGVPYFAGSMGNYIYFAQLTNAGGNPKVTYFPFDEKGKMGNALTLTIPNYKPSTVNFITYIPDGYNEIKGIPYYSEKLGFAFYSEGHFYFSQINAENNNLEIMRYTEKGGFETVFSTPEFQPEKKRFSVEKALYFNGKEWIVCAMVENNANMVQIVGEKINTIACTGSPGATPKYNHAQLMHPKHGDKFLLPTKSGVLFLERKTLPSKDGLTLKSL